MKENFIDEFYNIHIKGKELGQGGQGVVFRTRDPDIAVKIVLENGQPITDEQHCEHYREKLRKVKTLPIPLNIHLARPAAILKDSAGYAMQLLNDMLPFKHFWPEGIKVEDMKSEIPDWLQEMPNQEAIKIVHYQKTGGLRRRLLGLSKCAGILAQLHAEGLVYGDVSPANIYISGDLSNCEVWLIDADNLKFESGGKGSGVYTPGFGAPELVQGIQGGSMRTDCYAFAIMAFYLLTLQHPFIGNYLEEGGEGDWADDNVEEDVEEKAYAGLLPWIDDQEDDINYTDNGLPRPLVLTEGLQRLFQRTFGPGRTEFWRRPSIFHWPEELARAADKTIVCSHCKMSFYYDNDANNGKCPYCEATSSCILQLESYFWTQNTMLSAKSHWSFMREFSANTVVALPVRLFQPFSMTGYDEAILQLEERDNSILLKKAGSEIPLKFHVALPEVEGGKFHEFVSVIELPLSSKQTGFWIFSQGKTSQLITKCSFAEKAQ